MQPRNSSKGRTFRDVAPGNSIIVVCGEKWTSSCWTVNLRILGVAMVLSGCGGNSTPERYDVRGKVFWNGSPVPAGMITFESVESNKNVGDGFASIEDGKFDTSSGGRGHFGGRHKVTITGTVPIDLNDADMGTKPIFEPFETTVEFPQEQTTREFTVE